MAFHTLNRRRGLGALEPLDAVTGLTQPLSTYSIATSTLLATMTADVASNGDLFGGSAPLVPEGSAGTAPTVFDLAVDRAKSDLDEARTAVVPDADTPPPVGPPAVHEQKELHPATADPSTDPNPPGDQQIVEGEKAQWPWGWVLVGAVVGFIGAGVTRSQTQRT